MALEWQLARDVRCRQECWLTGDFCLLVEPTDKTLLMYRAAVIRGNSGPALYRSARTWPEDEAKRQAVIAGGVVARREARKHAEIAEVLGRYKRGF